MSKSKSYEPVFPIAYGGGLISKRVNDLYQWKKRYARLELEGK